MKAISQYPQPQRPAGPDAPWPWYPPDQPPASTSSTRLLTTTKWLTAGIVVLLIPLMALWLMNGYANIRGLRALSGRVAGANSGDGKGLKGGAEAIAWLEFLVLVQWATLVAVVLLGIFAFLAGAGLSWARVVCTVLIVFPIAVIVFGVIDSGPRGLWGLVLLIPFFVLVVLWWLPGTSRGIRTEVAVRSRPSATPW